VKTNKGRIDWFLCIFLCNYLNLLKSLILNMFMLLLIETTDCLSENLLSKCENLTCCCKKHWIAYMLFLQVLLQIQSDPTQATRYSWEVLWVLEGIKISILSGVVLDQRECVSWGDQGHFFGCVVSDLGLIA